MKPSAIAFAVVAAVVGAASALLLAQAIHPFPFLNDAVLHFGLVKSIASAGARGQSFLDPWVPEWTLGFPVFHYYQILPHFFVVAAQKATFGAVSLLTTFRVVEALSAALLPIPVYFAMRHFGVSPARAAAAAVLALAPRTNYLHGLELESSTWQGLGQFTQAFGMLLLPLALARSWSALRGASSIGVAAALLAATTLAHVALGALALLAAALFTLVAPREIGRRLPRLALLAALSLAGASFTLVPIARDFAYYNVSALVPSWKYDSFGHETVLRLLSTGALFDFGRLPVVTILVAAGVVFSAVRARRDEASRALLALFLAYLALYFGRPTWGRLLDFLPLGDGFHFSRVLAAVQLTGVSLAGLAVGAAFERIARDRKLGRAAPFVATALALAIFSPIALDRGRYLAHNAALVNESAAGYAREKDDVEASIKVARGEGLGRAYAGLGPAGGPEWGGAFMVGWAPVYDWLPFRGVDGVGFLHHHYSLNADLFDRFDERNPNHFRVFGIRRVVAPEDLVLPPSFRQIAKHGRFRVYEVGGDENGFVELVDVPYAVHVKKSELGRVQARWLASELPAQHVHPRVRLADIEAAEEGDLRIEGTDVRFPTPAPLPSAGTIGRVERSGEDFKIGATASRECVLLFKMTFHPAWKAIVDEGAAKTMHVFPSYVGVPLSAGDHTIELRYDPGMTKPVLASAGLIVLAAGIVLTRRRPE